MPTYADQASFILPTEMIVTELLERLSCMENATYDFAELMSLSVSALSIRNEAPARIVQYAGEYQRLARIGQISEYTQDMERLSNAWRDFTARLFNIYDTVNIWDERGCANLYYKQLVGRDIVLSLFPTDQPRRYPHVHYS